MEINCSGICFKGAKPLQIRCLRGHVLCGCSRLRYYSSRLRLASIGCANHFFAKRSFVGLNHYFGVYLHKECHPELWQGGGASVFDLRGDSKHYRHDKEGGIQQTGEPPAFIKNIIHVLGIIWASYLLLMLTLICICKGWSARVPFILRCSLVRFCFP